MMIQLDEHCRPCRQDGPAVAMQSSNCPNVGRQRFSIARKPGITKRSCRAELGLVHGLRPQLTFQRALREIERRNCGT